MEAVCTDLLSSVTLAGALCRFSFYAIGSDLTVLYKAMPDAAECTYFTTELEAKIRDILRDIAIQHEDDIPL